MKVDKCSVKIVQAMNLNRLSPGITNAVIAAHCIMKNPKKILLCNSGDGKKF